MTVQINQSASSNNSLGLRSYQLRNRRLLLAKRALPALYSGEETDIA